LRDISGTVQVVINDEKIAGELRAEWCEVVLQEMKIPEFQLAISK